ncbi:MAG: hypothetical protein AB7K37_10060 [Cyclobacteriaceae bacterium]
MNFNKTRTADSLLIIALFLIVSACGEKRFPYGQTFRDQLIESSSIEPIIESITVDDRLDSEVVRAYFERQLNSAREAEKTKAKDELDKAKMKYDQALKTQGKYIADGVYLKYVNEAKEKYDALIAGKGDSARFEFYFERLRNPTVFEEITVKFRFSKDGPLLVQRYRIDIFKNDTSFYELKGDKTIKDYVN